jgi:tryptophan halogenase
VIEFNKQMSEEYVFIRDFVIMHYHITEREDTDFWRQCKNMAIPQSLQHRLDLFKQTGRVFQQAGDVFAENNWTQVMLGQGLMPEQYHPIVDVMSDRELTHFLTGLRARTDNIVSQLPSHQQFIENYCKAESI